MNIDELIGAWIRPQIRELTSYHVPDPGECVKLDAMENPYAWPPELVEQWLARLRQVQVNRYPDPAARALVRRLREALHVPEGAGVLLGNGSDELIQILAMAMTGVDRTLLAPEPGFVMYRMIARFTGMGYVGVPLRESDFSLDMPAMRRAIAQHRPAVIFLAYPNNPTGNLFAAEHVEEILDLAPGVVVLDEAYAPFAEASFMSVLEQRPHLLVMRTLSKLGLAGLRLGLLAGHSAWIGELDKLRLPYNVNVLTQVSAEFALTHQAVFDDQTLRIRRARASLYDALEHHAGVRCWPSRANFILLRTLGVEAGTVFERLKARGVLVKNLSGSGPPLQDCLRVTVGTPEDNRLFIEALDCALAEG
jgi:histidinol-phosphate aminotransferase